MTMTYYNTVEAFIPITSYCSHQPGGDLPTKPVSKPIPDILLFSLSSVEIAHLNQGWFYTLAWLEGHS